MKKTIILLTILLAMPGIVLAAPQSSGAIVQVANNTQFSPFRATSPVYGFQITWNDSAAGATQGQIPNMTFECNFGGTTTNYTSTKNTTGYPATNQLFNNTAGVYWINFTHITNISLTNTLYTYRWFATNSSGVQNATAAINYFIRKNQTVPLFISMTTFDAAGTPTQSNKTGTGGVTSYEGKGNVYASCWMGTLSGNDYTSWGTDYLYKAGTSWTQGSGGAESLGKGTYTIKCNSTGNTNYTNNATGISFTLTMITGSGGGGGGGIPTPSISLPKITMPKITVPSLKLPTGIPGIETIRVRIQEISVRIKTWISNMRFNIQPTIDKMMNWFRR